MDYIYIFDSNLSRLNIPEKRMYNKQYTQKMKDIVMITKKMIN